jgi:chorismate synthase
MESLHGIADRPFQNLEADMALLNTLDFAVLDETAKEKMMFCIEDAAAQGDSVGGILETVITGLPAGLGDPFFDSVESELSHLLFSVPAVKGVSFGEGFGFADLYGSQANDAFIYDEGIKTETNRNGGINGGITNGMPVRIHTAVKPTPSIYKPQKSVDYATKEETTLQIQGRHDPCILHRARIVIESAAAFGLLDLWMAWAAQEAL